MYHQGKRVGEYELVRELGRGRFGHVWLAYHHVWGDREPSAVKLATDPGYVRALQREGRILRRLTHPNVVAARAFDPFADTPYVAMDYVDGCSLRALVGRRLLGVDESLAVLGQVLAGLGYAHGQGVVHRDLKPENILVDRRCGAEGFDAPGLVKLADFGLGRYVPDGSESSPAPSIVMSGSVVGDDRVFGGTLAYMAPEVLGGAGADPPCDLYACGMLLFEMLTGRRPAGAASLRDLGTPLAPALDELFRRAYAPRERRFSTAAEFLESLRALRAGRRVDAAGSPRDPMGSTSGAAETAAAPPGGVAGRETPGASAAAGPAGPGSARAGGRDADTRRCDAEAARDEAQARRHAAAADRARAKARRLRAEAESARVKFWVKQQLRADRQRVREANARRRAEAAAADRRRRPAGAPRGGPWAGRVASGWAPPAADPPVARATWQQRKRAAAILATAGGLWLFETYVMDVCTLAAVLLVLATWAFFFKCVTTDYSREERL